MVYSIKAKPAHSSDALSLSLEKARELIFSQQQAEGYWWYTLEANESINAEYIFLSHYLGFFSPQVERRLSQRILSSQTSDGSWPLYYGGPGDLSVTIECYWALKLAGFSPDHPQLKLARQFILDHGGLSQCRIFTRIHLALFGLLDWAHCPAMPVSLIYLPAGAPISIYEFSSWARSCIVPLLILNHTKKIRQLPVDFLNELYAETSLEEIDWSFKAEEGLLSIETFLLKLDPLLKKVLPAVPKRIIQSSLRKCEVWIREHIEKTEDIYPALAYSAMALFSMGYDLEDPTIQKCLRALSDFQMPASSDMQPVVEKPTSDTQALYQQCCISPVWDTPWAGVALVESGADSQDERLLKSGQWLLSKQILETYGDWHCKNKRALPGGWSFEFQNEYFPDVDDTVQVMAFLKYLPLPLEQKEFAIKRGTDWLLSMQSRNGGWGAFDKNNTKEIVNRIPFSDHKACLDPPSPDLTGRVVEFLALSGMSVKAKPLSKAISYLEKTQESFGGWWARWAVNYLFGTSCVLQGFAACGYDMNSPSIRKAVSFLKSVQREDGGFGESCDSYNQRAYVGLPESVPSQTAWALMGLVAAGYALTDEAKRAADFLISSQNLEGGWNEKHFTGTGFPGHFYIRYHGYRYFFPLLALSRYKKAILV